MTRRIALAVAVGDPEGHLIAGVERFTTRLASLFMGVGALVTTESDGLAQTLNQRLGARIAREPGGLNRAGRHRRRSIEVALELQPDAVLFSDLDHILRWIETDEGELRRCLDLTTDFVVVGRSQSAMAASPQRLRDTERIVNHIYELMTGRDWDLMFAVRLMSARAARAVVESSTEDSIANDVEWPLLVERRGFSLGYFAGDGLSYRTLQDFGAAADSRDGDAALWIARVEITAEHARTLGRFVEH